MIKGFTFNGVHSSEYFIVNSVERSILPSLNERLHYIPNRAGAYDFGVDISIREFRIDVTLIEKSTEDLYARLRDITSWLYTEEPEEFILDHEPDKFYKARLAGNTNLDTLASFGTATLVFICPDPYAYSKDEKVVLLDSQGVTTITNTANADTYPIIRAEFKAPSTYLAVATADKHIYLGRPAEVDEIEVVEDERVLDDDMTDNTLWTQGSNVDGGIVQGTFEVTSDGFRQAGGDYGTGDAWHGAAAIRALDEPIQDFTVEAITTILSDKDEQVGRIEVYLLDVNGQSIGKIAMKDLSTAGRYNYAEARAGDLTNGTYFLSEYGNYRGVWADFQYGMFRIQRINTSWRAYFGIIDRETGRHHTRRTRFFNDIEGKYTAPLAQIQIHVAAHSDKEVVKNLIFHHVRVIKHNEVKENEVPYIVQEGDVIEVDCARAAVLKNGEPFLESLDPSSDFFPLKRGDTSIAVSPSSDVVDMQVRYRERWL